MTSSCGRLRLRSSSVLILRPTLHFDLSYTHSSTLPLPPSSNLASYIPQTAYIQTIPYHPSRSRLFTFVASCIVPRRPSNVILAFTLRFRPPILMVEWLSPISSMTTAFCLPSASLPIHIPTTYVIEATPPHLSPTSLPSPHPLPLPISARLSSRTQFEFHRYASVTFKRSCPGQWYFLSYRYRTSVMHIDRKSVV